MGQRKPRSGHDSGERSVFVSSSLKWFGKQLFQFSTGLLRSNPIMAMIAIPVLFLTIAFFPLIMINLVAVRLTSIHPVFGILFYVGLQFAIVFGLLVLIGRKLGYDIGVHTLGEGLHQLYHAVLKAVKRMTISRPIGESAQQSNWQTGRSNRRRNWQSWGTDRRSNEKAEEPDTGTDSFLVPLSDLKRDEMPGYNEGLNLFDRSTPPVHLKPNYSTLVLGEPGAGKTTTINLLLRQMDATPDEPVVIFDYKGEFEDEDLFPERTLTVLSLLDSDETWNVFNEARNEGDFREIADKLIDADEDDNRNEFFQQAATELLWAALIHLNRTHGNPHNRKLVEFFEQPRLKMADKLLEHGDLQRIGEQIGGEDNTTGRDIVATARPFVMNVFTGDFGEVGGFSVRNYLDNPVGRVLVVQVDIAQFERTKPVFRFLIDWAIQHGLGDPSKNAYYVLDEFQRVPNLRNIENLTGAGRAQRAQAILGLQSIEQLKSTYDEGLANSIIAGTTQEILMRPGDTESSEHIQERIGSQIIEHEEEAPGFGQRNIKHETVDYLSQRELNQFATGEAVISTPDGIVHGRIKRWADLSPEERAQLTRIPQ